MDAEYQTVPGVGNYGDRCVRGSCTWYLCVCAVRGWMGTREGRTRPPGTPFEDWCKCDMQQAIVCGGVGGGKGREEDGRAKSS